MFLPVLGCADAQCCSSDPLCSFKVTALTSGRIEFQRCPTWVCFQQHITCPAGDVVSPWETQPCSRCLAFLHPDWNVNWEEDHCSHWQMLPCTRLSHLWLLRGIFSMKGNTSSAIFRELQVGDLSTSTAMDSIRWSSSITLGRGTVSTGRLCPSARQKPGSAKPMHKQSPGDGPQFSLLQ